MSLTTIFNGPIGSFEGGITIDLYGQIIFSEGGSMIKSRETIIFVELRVTIDQIMAIGFLKGF